MDPHSWRLATAFVSASGVGHPTFLSKKQLPTSKACSFWKAGFKVQFATRVNMILDLSKLSLSPPGAHLGREVPCPAARHLLVQCNSGKKRRRLHISASATAQVAPSNGTADTALLHSPLQPMKRVNPMTDRFKACSLLFSTRFTEAS